MIPVRLAALAAAAALCACAAPTHVATYAPKRRDYPTPEGSADSDQPGSPGSLWRDGRSASMLFTDARALRQNDLVVVRVEEIADAQRSANTDISRETDASAKVSAFLRAANLVPPVSLDSTAQTAFKGLGSTARTERLTATVPATVRKVLPNGNLFIEGHRVVLVNAEEQHFYISGVVRPIDIDQENGVKSSMVADAEIEFTGRGVLTENQRQGWVSRYLGWLWPF